MRGDRVLSVMCCYLPLSSPARPSTPSHATARYRRGDTTWGLDMVKGGIADMRELGIRESFKSKLQV